MLDPIQDWDDAFANMAHIAGSEKLPQMWTDRAAAYRSGGVKIDEDVPYGEHPREKFDLIWPDGTPKGLVVFIHGGFWMRLDKSFWTDFAEGARANGWAVCMPSYTLAPDARISHMTTQIARAISCAAAQVAGPIRITGHSAGGHLASRMICDDTPLDADVLSRIQAVQSISGLHDLRPLMHTAMNDVLHLDEEEAKLESAALHRPVRAVPYCCYVGGGERPEFIRQSKLMAQMWQGLDMPARCVIDGDHNHFTVIEGLCQPDSAITLNLLGKD
ncbi:alpha/beta hydrolase [Amylibacter sp. IMCC11727]|uniref:alpha/beta hydrolase n=1 Tax=Amylibacter sp. IMCC11727 TaxID=3039851 RepID=UPI00244E5924|nr:alpha/beta hydrolase [Amylibacter sp. IMCC11727]WGI23303.1 alpha/beta hydrolase [Amylibacter sp. IMCC11727]